MDSRVASPAFGSVFASGCHEIGKHRVTVWACSNRPNRLCSCVESRAQNALLEGANQPHTLKRRPSPAQADPSVQGKEPYESLDIRHLPLTLQPCLHFDLFRFMWACFSFSSGIYHVFSQLLSSLPLPRRGTGEPGSLIRADKGQPNS